ncbi:protein lifeguard 1 isoform X2 [Conger conger]|uniref:protein lifeguard 1 isoform X2 n=1 Tax=Conger conger TaxID=82655 RepID=UPI002A5AD676|nr:protein lifeguard 1 isoform X2 [Conger conger]
MLRPPWAQTVPDRARPRNTTSWLPGHRRTDPRQWLKWYLLRPPWAQTVPGRARPRNTASSLPGHRRTTPRRTCPLPTQHRLNRTLLPTMGMPMQSVSSGHRWTVQGWTPRQPTTLLAACSFPRSRIKPSAGLSSGSVVCVFTFSETVKETVQKNLWVYLSSYILFVIVAVSLSICSSFSRQHPWNLVGLSVVTLTMSYMVGTVASYHNTTAVIIAMGITIGVSFAIIIFSAQTRVDFTLCNGTLLILSVILLMSGFFCFFFYSNVVQVVYGSLGAILYSVFLAVDCQLVMGRKKYSLDPEEYVFASLILYLDIITIFLYLLILLGGSSSN